MGIRRRRPGSTVAGKLGSGRTGPPQGEVAFLFGYWSGIPDNGYGTIEIHEHEFASRSAVEDGLHLLIAMGDAELTRGTQRERHRRYVELLRRFPEMIEPDVLEGAEIATDVSVAPESLMRGFFRKPTGPGWALVGDASHFKHPGTAQGIADAVEQAIYVAEALSARHRAWRSTRPGAMPGRPSTTTGPSPGAASLTSSPRRSSGVGGRATRTPARTSATPSAAWWSRPR